jgi:heat-inducible transcriptional repressor
MRVEPLDARRQDILATLVRGHISTGEPVSSAWVARRCGHQVSPATIRNEMAMLDEAGYLQQPHTSAGRVPTAKAYEFYAQDVASRGRLDPADQRWIQRHLGSEKEGAEELLARAPHVLSELCHGVGLVLVPPLEATVLDQVRFVPLEGRRVLAVLVARGGLVRDKIIRGREAFRPEELARMSAYLNQYFRGWTLEAIRGEMERRVAAERSQFLRQALALCRESFAGSAAGALHVEGAAHLLDAAEARPEELRFLLEALEEKERLARLLTDFVETPERPLRILIGLEQLSPAMKDYAIIGARYGRGQAGGGSLGLLGRTRMDYDRAVTAVAYLAALFNRLLAEE